jgi:hypothetical protein
VILDLVRLQVPDADDQENATIRRRPAVSIHDSGLLIRIDVVSGRAVAAYDGGAGIEVLAFY